MELKYVLTLKRLPYVASCVFTSSFQSEAALVEIVADAVTFTRASSNVAQVLIQIDVTSINEEVTEVADEFEKQIQVLLDGLQVDDESLKANLKKTQSSIHFVLEITSCKKG
jgi:hypothetical protein